MAVSIEIFGDDASEVLAEIMALASGFGKPDEVNIAEVVVQEKVSASSETTTPAEQVEPEKKRRGRPAKNATTAVVEEAPVESSEEETSAAGASDTSTNTADEEDEFAAFRAAAEKSDAEDNAAKASVPERKWTDADLGALCNQAATKMGNPAPVKEIITRFVPEGEVAHSRNIPEESRAEFAAAIEAKAGIEFAG